MKMVRCGGRLLAVHRKRQQNVARCAAKKAVARIHEHHAACDSWSGDIQRTALRWHMIHRRPRLPGVQVPQELALHAARPTRPKSRSKSAVNSFEEVVPVMRSMKLICLLLIAAVSRAHRQYHPRLG